MPDLSEGAIKAIQSTAREAEINLKAVMLMDSPDPRKKFLIRGQKHEEISVPPPARKHHVYTLVDLLDYAGRMIGAESDPDAPRAEKPALVIWHNVVGVTLVLDDADRRDTVFFPLEKSAAWKLLAKIEEQGVAQLAQRDFIRLLKNEFAVSEAIVAQFRKIDFRVMKQAQGNVNRGKESLGKSIEAEVSSGGQELPEEVEVVVPIYLNAGEGETYSVRLLLDYDAETAKILITVEADALEKRVQAHQASIHGRCSSTLADVPVYFGAP